MRGILTSMRFRLILLVGIAVVPALALILYSGARERQNARAWAEREALNVALFIVSQQNLLTETTRQLLASLSRLPQVRAGDPVACSALLASMIREHPIYANIGVAWPNGDSWCSAVPAAGPVNFADRAWFAEALLRRDFVFGGYVMGRITGRPLAAFAYPILDGAREVQAVLYAGLDLAWLNDLIAHLPLPPGMVLTVADETGTILARTVEPEEWVGRPCPEAEIVQAVLAEPGPRALEAAGVDGVRRLYAIAPFGGGPEGMAHVYVGTPVSVAYTQANRALFQNLVLLGVVALVAWGAAWLGGDLLVRRPTRRLVEAARRLASGDLHARTGMHHDRSELGMLAQAFDEMAQGLEEQHREREQAEAALRESEQRLAHLLAVSPTIIYTLNPDGFAATWVSPNVTAVLGYTPEEVLQPNWWADHLHPEDRDQAFANAAHVLTENSVIHEYRFYKKNGELIWVRDELRLLRDEHGNPVEIVGAWVDITERKQAEERVVKQLQVLTALYTGAQKLAESLDLEAVAREVTRTCVEIFGVRLAWLGRAEPDGRVTVVSQFPPEHPYPHQITVRWDDAPQGQGPTGRAIRSGVPEVTAEITTDPGFVRWREVALTHGFRCSAAFPLISRGHTFGALNLYSDIPDFFAPERLDMFQAFANQAAAALENVRLFAETQRRLKQVQALRNIDMAITASLDPRLTLRVLLEEVTTQLAVDAADVLLLNPHVQVLEYAAGRGFRTKLIERTRLRLGEGHAGRAALERRVLSVSDLAQADDFLRRQLTQEEGFVAYYAAPMIAKGRVLGVLETFHRTPLGTNAEWLELLEALAAQAAIAIENAQLFHDLEQSNVDLRLAYDATIEGWSRALDLRDRETEGHTQRVTEFTVKLARAMGMREEEIVHVRRGALLHDMGKMGIPDSILVKPDKLTDEEWEIMRRHPQYAYEMLSPIEYLRPALDIPYCHHEKWDGTGYPRGLKGEQIPLSARIFAVADVWDALTSDRPYRPAWPREKALEYIREQAGKHFDPKVVEAFLKLIESEEPAR
ncbi:GAF domain-containing protein [Candidatus Bipolaricaulota bacterium]|nr:GAF domain-containing protein [Candidatus Bipolaricaulota bacterium]